MKPSSEALLISALVNSGDAEGAGPYGISPEMFVGYQAEYRWLLSYVHTYGTQPSRDALKTRFPDFPVTDHRDIAFAADEVRHAHVKRELVKTVKSAAVSVAEGDIDEAILAMSSFSPPAPIQPLRNALIDSSLLATYDERVDALAVPWPSLQRITGGIRKGDLWYVAARLGQGKSWSLGCFVRDAVLAGRKVLFYSLEMSERQVLTRMHVLLGSALGLGVDHSSMRDKTFDLIAYKRILDQIRERVPGELYVHDSSKGRVSPANIVAQGKEADLVVVDYAGLMSSPMGGRAIDDWRAMAAISNMLKEVAVSADIRILAAAQINRDGDQPGWRPPKVKNLAQSDALGQDGDVVLTHKQYSPSTMVYGIEKNRHGEGNQVFFTRFNPNQGQFAEITREQADDIKDSENDD